MRNKKKMKKYDSIFMHLRKCLVFSVRFPEPTNTIYNKIIGFMLITLCFVTVLRVRVLNITLFFSSF